MRHNMQKFNIGRLAAFLLAVLMLVALAPVAGAANPSGDCGENVDWSIKNGVLTISGEGEMNHYAEHDPAPWSKYSESIVAVKIEDGVTRIGRYAFFRLEKLTSVTLAPSVEKIGGWAFYECLNLVSVDLAEVTEIGESAFEGCVELASLRLPQTLKTLRFHAFYRCESILSVTIPASVTEMESTVFAYCSSLRVAVVKASISNLPDWTFYGCHNLNSLYISESVTEVGSSVFDLCGNLESVNYGGMGEAALKIKESLPETVIDFEAGEDISSDVSGEYNSSSTDEKGNTVTVSGTYFESENSSVTTEVTHTKGNGSYVSDLVIDAVIENDNGWDDVKNSMSDAMGHREVGADKNSMNINIHIKGAPTVSKDVLSIFSGKDADVHFYTNQGAIWEINGKNISKEALSDKYDLTYEFSPLTDPTDEQREIVGNNGYLLVFNSDIDFKVEIRLPIGNNMARKTAVFFSPEKKEGYTRMQATVIDDEGLAHFYLGMVKKKAEYLIGVESQDNVIDFSSISDVIIPDELAGDYGVVEYNEPIEFVVTDVKSSWGLSAGQVTVFLVAGMLGCIIIVGVVVFIIFKSKNKNFYDPVLDGAKKVDTKKKPVTKKKK